MHFKNIYIYAASLNLAIYQQIVYKLIYTTNNTKLRLPTKILLKNLLKQSISLFMLFMRIPMAATDDSGEATTVNLEKKMLKQYN